MKKLKLYLILALGLIAFWGLNPPASAINLNMDGIEAEGIYNPFSFSDVKRDLSVVKAGFYINIPPQTSNSLYNYYGYNRYAGDGGSAFSLSYRNNSVSDSGQRWWGVHYKNDGEGKIVYYAIYTEKEDNKLYQGIRSLNIPSTTAVSYDGVMYDEIYFYHNTVWLRNSKGGDTLQYIGNLRIKNLVVLANPAMDTDNLRFIDYKKGQARSATLSLDDLKKYFFGNFKEEDLKIQKMNNSYSVVPGGYSMYPLDFYSMGRGQSQNAEVPGFLFQNQSFFDPYWQGGGNSNTSNDNSSNNSNNTLEEYNQCVSYYTAVKTYASYDRACSQGVSEWWQGQDLPSNAYHTITDIYNWKEGDTDPTIDEAPAVCDRFFRYKKRLLKHLPEQADEIIEKSKDYWINSEALVIKDYCGDKPDEKIGDKKSFFANEKVSKFLKDYYDKITGKTKVGNKNGKEISKKELDKSFINLGLLKTKCDNPQVYSVGTPIWDKGKLKDLKIKYCKEYEEALLLHNQKYNGIEYNSGFEDMYSTGFEEDLGLNKIMTYFSSDYNSGYNFFYNDKICQNKPIVPEWDFLVYIPFFFVVLYIIKYIF